MYPYMCYCTFWILNIYPSYKQNSYCLHYYIIVCKYVCTTYSYPCIFMVQILKPTQFELRSVFIDLNCRFFVLCVLWLIFESIGTFVMSWNYLLWNAIISFVLYLMKFATFKNCSWINIQEEFCLYVAFNWIWIWY